MRADLQESARQEHDVVVRRHDELDERTGRPLIVAEELRQLDAPYASRLVVPALLGSADVPPPDEGVVALDNAFQGGHPMSDARADAAR